MLGGNPAHIGFIALKSLRSSVEYLKAYLKVYLGLCLIITFALLSPGAYANEDNADTADKTKPTPTKAIEKVVMVADLAPEFKVKLEGKVLQAAVSHDQAGAMLVRAEPIFNALNDVFKYNVEEGVLVVKRSQDGVVMELYTDTGIVKANGKALGKLKKYGQIAEGSINLTPNAIAVMSGAIGKINKKEKQINFNLDPRLKVATGFEVFINEQPLGNIEPGPKAIGSVMLLPLQPIAKELGHSVEIIDGGATVIVTRSQDSAKFALSLDTGLVKLNGRPVGVSKDVTYFDKTNLLLPLGTIETLTGTHIDVEGGTSRINITLDSRLKDVIKPGAQVKDLTTKTPLTIETIQLHVGTDTMNTVSADLRMRGINGRLRYEIPDLPTSAAEAKPSWLSLDYAHVKGGYGAVGDYSADLRELDGVGLRRIKGASYAKENTKGRWALAAGVPSSGSKKISEDQSRLKFSGLAAGARYASKDGWEAGLSVKSMPTTDGLSSDQMAVLSAISGRLGRNRAKKLKWNVQADAGVFHGPAREKPVDARINASARYSLSKKINIEANANYDGAEFLRSDLNAEKIIADTTTDNDPDIVEEDFVPDTRKRGQDYASYGVAMQVTAGQTLGPLDRPAMSVRYNHTQSGMFIKNGNESTTDTIGVSVNTSVRKTGTNISADYTGYTQSRNNGGKETGDQITARVYQKTKYATARAQYSSTRKGESARVQRVDAQLSATPYKLALPKDGTLSIAPSVAASWSNDSNAQNIHGGVVANLNSGNLLGEKTKLTASMGVLQNFSGNSNATSDKFLSVSLGRELRINKNLSMGVSYRNNLEGDQRVGVYLDGRFDFNEKRKFRQTDDGRGVLKGRAFLDKNRDGIKQEDEPGIQGALVRVKNTRMALRTDSAGYFTIQNIKVGIHELQVDGRSLPLGYSLADGTSTKASIHEGHITDVPMPIVQRGQIRGFAYVDKDGNGQHDKGETRLEGAKLLLTDVDDTENKHVLYATSFGQYAFDDLPAATYELVISKTNTTDTEPLSEPILVNLAEAEDLMARINIAARLTGSVAPNEKGRYAPSQVAQQNSEPSDDVGRNISGDRVNARKSEIPPPDIITDDPAP